LVSSFEFFVYLPTWQKYCTKKVLPNSWKYLGALSDVSGDLSAMDGNLRGLLPNAPVVAPLIVPKTEIDEAECIGHALNKKGRVFMTLKWLDGKEKDSIHEVKGVMGSSMETHKFGKTWLDYCEKKKIDNQLFIMKGVSVVKSIIGHVWSEGGRPVVEVEWEHGERSKENVMDVLEVSKDQNGFNLAWNAYCDTLGELDSGFRKGLVVRSRKVAPPASKKRRRSG
jgi:hypothetical protein